MTGRLKITALREMYILPQINSETKPLVHVSHYTVPYLNGIICSCYTRAIPQRLLIRHSELEKCYSVFFLLSKDNCLAVILTEISMLFIFLASQV